MGAAPVGPGPNVPRSAAAAIGWCASHTSGTDSSSSASSPPVMGLDSGAVDYVTKPLRLAEVLARSV